MWKCGTIKACEITIAKELGDKPYLALKTVIYGKLGMPLYCIAQEQRNVSACSCELLVLMQEHWHT